MTSRAARWVYKRKVCNANYVAIYYRHLTLWRYSIYAVFQTAYPYIVNYNSSWHFPTFITFDTNTGQSKLLIISSFVYTPTRILYRWGWRHRPMAFESPVRLYVRAEALLTGLPPMYCFIHVWPNQYASVNSLILVNELEKNCKQAVAVASTTPSTLQSVGFIPGLLERGHKSLQPIASYDQWRFKFHLQTFR